MLIRTSRFVLRDLVETDCGAFIRYLAGSLTGLTDERQAVVFFAHLLSSQRERPTLKIQLGIFEHDISRLCGFAALRKDPQRHDLATFEIELASDYWGRYRMAVEVTEALLSYGFQHLDINVVV